LTKLVDIQGIKDMGVESYSIGYNFVPIGRDVDKMSLSKLLDRASKLLYYSTQNKSKSVSFTNSYINAKFMCP